MTQGSIVKQLVLFAVPLIVGEFFQMLYNTVDSAIVGNFVGKEALAAVGATGTAVNTLVGFFSGLSVGATVIIARYFGAKDDKQLHAAVQSTYVMTLAMGVLLTLLGIFGAPYLLQLLNTPKDAFDQALLYLRIYFAGASGLIMFNMCSGILRAVGDSTRPLYVLILCSMLNVVLDLLFVLVFKMGVGGAALATIVSQFISAGVLLYMLHREEQAHRVELLSFRVDWSILKTICVIGVPIGLQKSIIALSNTVVLSYVNRFGTGAMAGWSVYRRADMVIQHLMQSFATATTTFVSQNLGADKPERVKKGVWVALGLSVLVTAVLSIAITLLSEPLVRMFNDDPEVLYYGSLIICTITPFQVLNCICQIKSGELRGRGKSAIAMVFMVAFYVVFRQVYLWLGWSSYESMTFVLLAFPLSWTLCSVAILIFLQIFTRRKKEPIITKP